jgi:hypothetical protein
MRFVWPARDRAPAALTLHAGHTNLIVSSPVAGIVLA